MSALLCRVLAQVPEPIASSELFGARHCHKWPIFGPEWEPGGSFSRFGSPANGAQWALDNKSAPEWAQRSF